MNSEKPERDCKRWRAAFDRRYRHGCANCYKYSSINSILRRQQTYRVCRDDENNVAELMVNAEKPERGCKSWRAVFDRDVNEEQCGRTTIRTVVVWGVLDGPAL